MAKVVSGQRPGGDSPGGSVHVCPVTIPSRLGPSSVLILSLTTFMYYTSAETPGCSRGDIPKQVPRDWAASRVSRPFYHGRAVLDTKCSPAEADVSNLAGLGKDTIWASMVHRRPFLGSSTPLLVDPGNLHNGHIPVAATYRESFPRRSGGRLESSTRTPAIRKFEAR